MRPSATGKPPSVGDSTKVYGPWIVVATVILPAIVAAVFNWMEARGEHVLKADDPAVTAGERTADHAYSALILPLAELVRRIGWGVIIVLGLILSYRICDNIWGYSHSRSTFRNCITPVTRWRSLRKFIQVLHDDGGKSRLAASCSLPSVGCQLCWSAPSSLPQAILYCGPRVWSSKHRRLCAHLWTRRLRPRPENGEVAGGDLGREHRRRPRWSSIRRLPFFNHIQRV